MGCLSSQVLSCRTADDICQAWDCGKAAVILTVENGAALGGRLERIERLARDGVRMMTLTWNGENELGSGHETDRGLSSFGKAAVQELERQGILVDVSHLNDQGFEDLLDISEKPFVASHSNAGRCAVTGATSLTGRSGRWPPRVSDRAELLLPLPPL